MVDSSGPSHPRVCNTVGLQSLGDVEGWGLEGKGKYLFELVDGLYRRVALPVIPPEPIKWLLDFQLRNPFVFSRGDGRLKKWQSGGRVLASFFPYGIVKLRMLLDTDKGYGVFGSRATLRLKYVSDFNALFRKNSTVVPPGSTLAFVLTVGPAPTANVKLLKGVELDWDATASGKQVGIVIRVPSPGARGDPPFLTRADVRVTVDDEIDMEQIRLAPNTLILQRLFWTDSTPDLARVEPYLV